MIEKLLLRLYGLFLLYFIDLLFLFFVNCKCCMSVKAVAEMWQFYEQIIDDNFGFMML